MAEWERFILGNNDWMDKILDEKEFKDYQITSNKVLDWLIEEADKSDNIFTKESSRKENDELKILNLQRLENVCNIQEESTMQNHETDVSVSFMSHPDKHEGTKKFLMDNNLKLTKPYYDSDIIDILKSSGKKNVKVYGKEDPRGTGILIYTIKYNL